MKCQILVICYLSLVIPATLAHAEQPRPTWAVNGLEINNTLGNTPQQNPKIIHTRDGYYLTVWEDNRFGYTNLYAQKMDESGNRLWDRDGVPVANTTGNQNFARLVDDGSGGAIVVWQDYRNGSADIFAQCLGPQGENFWGSEGIPVCKAPAGQLAPELVSDRAGGAIITWYDYRSGTGEDIYAQRIDKGGNPLWQKDGLPISETPGTQWYPKISSDDGGGAVIVWTDGRVSSADNNIYAQRVAPSGEILWEKDGIPICSAPQNQEHPVIIQVEGGVVAAWNDSRSGNIDVYAQKISWDGTPLWEKEGLAVITAPFSQENPKLAPDGAGGAIVIWNDNREEESAIFAQRIARAGKISWGEEGQVIAKSPAKQENPEIVKLPHTDWVVIWEDYRKGSSTLFAQKINPAGIPLWQEGGILLAYEPKVQEKPSAAASPDGGVMVAWQDLRYGNYDIFSQKLSSDGVLLWGESGLVICETIGLVVHQNVSMVSNGQKEVILVFEDARSGYLNIYAQKIDRESNLLWGKDGLPVAKVKAHQANPQMVADGAGGVIVAWEDGRNPNFPKIYAQRVTSSGRKVWQKGSIPLTKIDSRQSRPVMISDGVGGAMVAWQDERDPLSLNDLYGQRVSGAGELLWGKNGIALCAENGEQTEAVMTSDGTGGAMIAWTDYRRGDRNPDIYAQRINDSGKPLWQKEGVMVCGAPDVQRTPQLVSDGEGGVVIVWTDKGGGSYDIYAQRVNLSGQTLWLTDGIPICQSARTQQNPIAGGQQVIIWEDYRYGNWDIFAGSVSPPGRLRWGGEGIPVAALPLTQYAPQIANWKNDSIIATWEDYRSGKQYEIYLQKLTADGKVSWPENGVLVKTSNGARAPKLLALPKEDSFLVTWEDYTGGGKAIYGQKFTSD